MMRNGRSRNVGEEIYKYLNLIPHRISDQAALVVDKERIKVHCQEGKGGCRSVGKYLKAT